MSFTKLITIDGDFRVAREVEGGPMVTTDEVTKSLTVTRNFCVLRDYYQPLSQGSPDVRFTNAYLVSESPVSVGNGPMYFFQRTYAQVPTAWAEPRLIAFQIPGQSATQVSRISGQVIGWNQYGKASPCVLPVMASVQHNYVNAPGTQTNPFGNTPITQILYDGASVDYVGFVWAYAGTAQVPSGGNLISEPRWDLKGVTNPSIIPTLWTVEVQVQRWRGSIWEQQITTVNTVTL